MLISTRAFDHWTNVQNSFENYLTSIFFDSDTELKTFLHEEYYISPEKTDEILNLSKKSTGNTFPIQP